jgi:hypothetical protein
MYTISPWKWIIISAVNKETRRIRREMKAMKFHELLSFPGRRPVRPEVIEFVWGTSTGRGSSKTNLLRTFRGSLCTRPSVPASDAANAPLNNFTCQDDRRRTRSVDQSRGHMSDRATNLSEAKTKWTRNLPDAETDKQLELSVLPQSFAGAHNLVD